MVLDVAALGALVVTAFNDLLFGNPLIFGVALMIIIAIVIGLSGMGVEGAIALLVGFVFVLVDLSGILDSVYKFGILVVVGLILGIGLVRALKRE